MSCFKKVLLLLAIIGGINWGIYGIWGFNAVGWLLGGSMSWLAVPHSVHRCRRSGTLPYPRFVRP